ncbi:MAG: type II toxin-antitoxin system HicB family antitoxin [Chloroflexi bacterium]|nr:type II toxin-antitoxin system HicB family antitoxin [Chloroflexota bacterium]
MNRRVKTADEYLKEPYARILTPDAEGKGYTAEILEFLGCIAQGDTAEEAYTSLEETAREWIEAAVESGQEIPEPSTNIGYAGKVALRLPRSLHRQAVRMAERDGVSLNQFLVAAVAERVGATNLYARMLERLQPGVAQATLNVANNESNHLTMDAAIVNSSASAPPRRTRRR